MKVLTALLIVLVVGFGGYYVYTQNAKKDDTSAATTVGGKIAVVEKRDIDFAVHVAGEIAPAEQVSVRPEINGRIASMPVDIGDKVKKGDLLFALDDQELRNERDTAATEIDGAQLQLAQAARNFERSEKLFEQALISQEVFETSKTTLGLASNAVERAQRNLSILDERLTKSMILAPFNCTVLTRPVSVGQAVAGSGGMSGGTEVLTIADLNEMVINAHVNQADVIRLRQGQSVTVQVEAVSGLSVQGEVERIAPQATIKNNVKGFAARILIKEMDPRIQPGMTANISIPVESADNVLAVNLAAVFSDLNRETGQMSRYVYVQQGEAYSRRPVTIGAFDYLYAEVLSGLSEGDVVALEPPPARLILPDPEPTAAQRAKDAATTQVRPSKAAGGSAQPVHKTVKGT